MAQKTGPGITITRKSGVAAFSKRLAGLQKINAYVGVPSSGKNERTSHLLELAGKTKGKQKKARLTKLAGQDVTNSELLFIHTNGSKLKHIPPRPVLQPAIEAEDNKAKIIYEIEGAMRAQLAGDKEGAEKKMLRAALAGQNAARKWFTDPRNGWKGNAQRTIDEKGSDRPLIDTGALRAAIVGVVKEE